MNTTELKVAVTNALSTIIGLYQSEVESTLEQDNFGYEMFRYYLPLHLDDKHVRTASLINSSSTEENLFDIIPMRGICYPITEFVRCYLRDVHGCTADILHIHVSEDGEEDPFLHSVIRVGDFYYDTTYPDGTKSIHEHPLVEQLLHGADIDIVPRKEADHDPYNSFFRNSEISNFLNTCANKLYPADRRKTEFTRTFLN